MYMDYNTVVAGFPGWDRILDRYGVGVIVTKTVDSTGMLLLLNDRLPGNRRWVLVYSDGLGVVFVKHTPGNEEVIRRYGIDKRETCRDYEGGGRAFRKTLEYGESAYARNAIKLVDPAVRK